VIKVTSRSDHRAIRYALNRANEESRRLTLFGYRYMKERKKKEKWMNNWSRCRFSATRRSFRLDRHTSVHLSVTSREEHCPQLPSPRGSLNRWIFLFSQVSIQLFTEIWQFIRKRYSHDGLFWRLCYGLESLRASILLCKTNEKRPRPRADPRGTFSALSFYYRFRVGISLRHVVITITRHSLWAPRAPWGDAFRTDWPGRYAPFVPQSAA